MEYLPQILVICFFPIVLVRILKGKKAEKILSPVVMAYLVGIFISLLHLMPVNESYSKSISEGSIMIAIPMLLFSADIKGWLNHAGPTVLSFLFAVIAAVVSTAVFAFYFKDSIYEAGYQSGMLVGVFTGGTANMQAVGIALGVKTETFVVLNAAEMLWGGIYLIFLTSVAQKVFGNFLPNYKFDENEVKEYDLNPEIKRKDTLISILLSLIIVGFTVGLTFLIYGGIGENTTVFIILLLTTLSVAASFSKKIRELKGSFEAGDYLLLVFCIAIGMRSDFVELISTGGNVIIFTGGCMFLTIIIHLILSWMFKIDRDTTIITSTAAIYGPAFIGQIASALKNRQIIFAGMATGLIGYAIGSQLGIFLGLLLNYWLAN